MPEPFLYLQAMLAAGGASAILLLALGRAALSGGARRIQLACIAAMALGLALGCCVLQVPVHWPPANGLDRLLTIVLPGAFVVELLAASGRRYPWLVWCLRFALAMSIGGVLLHASVYLAGGPGGWTIGRKAVVLPACGGLLIATWGLLIWLTRRGFGVSIPLALAQAALCGGITVMMVGYLAGGGAALSLAGALAGTAIGTRLTTDRPSAEAAVGIGVVALFGLLFVGRFFGALSTGRAMTIFLAPLLCWATETPLLRCQRRWLVTGVRLALVAVPLLVVLALAKQDFDRDMLPLLGR